MLLEEQKIEINNKTMFYYRTNGESNITYFFLSGWGIPTTTFDMYIFAKKIHTFGHKIVIIDRYGQGKSERVTEARSFERVSKEIHQVIEKEKTKKNILIGHSIGSFYAFECAKRFDVIDEVVLLDGAPMTGTITKNIHYLNYLFSSFFIILRKCRVIHKLSIANLVKILAKIEYIQNVSVIPESFQTIACDFCKDDIYNAAVRNELKCVIKELDSLYKNTANLQKMTITSIGRNRSNKFCLEMKKMLAKQGVTLDVVNIGKASHYIHNEFPDKVSKIILDRNNQ